MKIVFLIIHNLLFRPLLPLARWLLPKRKAFENLNLTDKRSQSFRAGHLQADVAFEVSSEGELQQILPLLKELLVREKRIELVFCSSSVENNCIKLADEYENLRILRMPLLTFSTLGLKDWLTAKKLILCRYDFFPELFLYGMNSDVSFHLISGTLKDKQQMGLIKRMIYRFLYQQFDSIITASPQDLKRFRDWSITESVRGSFDFRIMQIKKRIDKATERLREVEYFPEMENIFLKYQSRERILFGSFWPIESKAFQNKEFQKQILNGKLHVALAPHQLNDAFIGQVVHNLKEILGEDFPIYNLIHNSPRDTAANTVEQYIKNPGIMIYSQKAILCELYCLYGHVFVGGGHGRSVHSLLEPYMAKSHVYCGPKTFRSTEFDLILHADSENLTVVKDLEEFYNCFVGIQLKGPREEIGNSLYDANFFDRYVQELLGEDLNAH